MKTFNADSMHRLAKMALDSCEVSSPQDALQLFSRYRLRIHLGHDWAKTLAGQACFLTALNTAVRAFLGGVEVHGDLSPVLRVPLYEGRKTSAVVTALGGTVAAALSDNVATLVLGRWRADELPEFCVSLGWNAWCAAITPASFGLPLECSSDNPLAGVAAAALGVNEAFLHIRGDLPDAGHRTVGISLWNPLALSDWQAVSDSEPGLKYLPSSLWLIGLGHLGQAYAWALGMLPYPCDNRPHLVLQDFDTADESNLSTCLLLHANDLGQRKVRLVARCLEKAGFTTDLVERRFGPDHRLMVGEPTTALFGVDNIAARRDLDSAGFSMVVEAGLGSGLYDFRNVRTHVFPGPRRATEIWPAADATQKAIELNAVYQTLADEHDDLCGMTRLASRAVATPFVGALAAAVVLAEVVRALHGGGVHAALDLRMKNLRHRIGAAPLAYCGTLPPYASAALLH